MEMHFANVWESIADAMPDYPAVSHGDDTLNWAEYDDRSARLAAAFSAAGLEPDSKIGFYMYNCNEYLETQYATFKMRGVGVNINYRYLDDELWYLLDNSDAEAIVFHSSLGDKVARVIDRLPKLKLLVEVDDGPTATDPSLGEQEHVTNSIGYEELMSSQDPMPRIRRSEDDIYMLYTGGTTGMPKGVMYDVGGITSFFIGGGFPLLGLTPPTDAALVAPMISEVARTDSQMVSLTCAPLMHGTGLWIGAFIPHLAGAHVATLTNRSLDPHELLATVEKHEVNSITIVGDSFAKPIIRALDEGHPDSRAYDTSSLKLMSSSGVMWTTEVKQDLINRIEQITLIDSMGSTEGSMGTQITAKGVDTDTGRFVQAPNTKVFTDDDREVEPGSDEIGMVAAGGSVPLGYFKDPEKSERTFRVIDGVRYSFPGDYAKVDSDGTLILLGRGSQVINTGGEKVFPEEVEEAVKRVDGINDCLVVGIDDERFGQAVTAVASTVGGGEIDESAVISSVKADLAGYKAPKRVVFVAEVPRASNGKADYPAARTMAADTLAG